MRIHITLLLVLPLGASYELLSMHTRNIINREASNRKLINATINNDKEKVLEALDGGADPNVCVKTKNGTVTALHYAMSNDNPTLINMLLSRGTLINLRWLLLLETQLKSLSKQNGFTYKNETALSKTYSFSEDKGV